MTTRRMTPLALGALVAAAAARASDPGTGDWPMWGGLPDRNVVSDAKGLPTRWDVASRKNVRWIASLGSQSQGNPVLSGGKVFVGTNNEAPRNPKDVGDRGVLMAFDEKDGSLLWQSTSEKLAAPGSLLVAAAGGRPALLRHQPRRGAGPRHRGPPRRGERRSLPGRRAGARELYRMAY
jgi:outer membrane protein assembly factor BamB